MIKLKSTFYSKRSFYSNIANQGKNILILSNKKLIIYKVFYLMP